MVEQASPPSEGQPDIGYRAVPHEEMAGYTSTVVDLCISTDACVLYGYVVQNDGNNAVATFHEGRNVLAPVIFAHASLANQAIPAWFNRGVELDAGLFVDLDAHTTRVTVFWRPRREREA